MYHIKNIFMPLNFYHCQISMEYNLHFLPINNSYPNSSNQFVALYHNQIPLSHQLLSCPNLPLVHRFGTLQRSKYFMGTQSTSKLHLNSQNLGIHPLNRLVHKIYRKLGRVQLRNCLSNPMFGHSKTKQFEFDLVNHITKIHISSHMECNQAMK